MKKANIVATKAEWQVQSRENDIFINIEKDELSGWNISTHRNNKEFIFKNYSSKEELKTAKIVIKLLEQAFKFIENNI